MPLNILLTPSNEWFNKNVFVKGPGVALAEQLTKAAECLNKVAASANLPLTVSFQKEMLKVPLYAADTLVVEIILVSSPFESTAKMVDEEQVANPENYGMRAVVDMADVANASSSLASQILNAVMFRPTTYVSSRVVLGDKETAQNVPTPFPVGFFEAVTRGCPRDGGLYMPRELPVLTKAELAYIAAPRPDKMKNQFHRTAQFVLEKLIGLPERFTLNHECGIRATPFDDEVQALKTRVAEAELRVAAGNDDAVSELATAKAALDAAVAKQAEATKAAHAALAAKLAACDVSEAAVKQVLSTVGDAAPRAERYGARELPQPRDISEWLAKAYAPETRFGGPNKVAATTVLPFNKLLPSDSSDGIKAAIDLPHVMNALKEIRVMEMCHGPTSCYEDFSLQLFAQFYDEARKYVAIMATNGDAGTAAIDAFLANGPASAQLLILYPQDGLTAAQEAAVTHYASSAAAGRVQCVAVQGDFEFCQRAAAKMMRDPALLSKITKGKTLTLANAVNWGRIVPLVAVYAQAYAECVLKGSDSRKVRHPLDVDTKESLKKRGGNPTGFDVAVPAGNLGNLVAAFTAKKMGIPIRKILVVTNENDALAQFVQTGTFDLASRFRKKCAAKPLDIAAGSNLERLLYLIHDGNTNVVRNLMNELERKKKFTVSSDVFERVVKATFWAAKSSDTNVKEAIMSIYNASSKTRLCDGVTASSISAVDKFCRVVVRDIAAKAAFEKEEKRRRKEAKEQEKKAAKEDAKEAEMTEKQKAKANADENDDTVPEEGETVEQRREFLSFFPIVLTASSHWQYYPLDCMRALHIPTLSHAEAGMPTPSSGKGKPKLPEPVPDIARRQVASLMKKCPQHRTTNAFKDAITPPKGVRPTPVVVKATYEAVVEQLLSVANNDYAVDAKAAEKATKEAAERVKKFDDARKKANAENLKRGLASQALFDAYTSTNTSPEGVPRRKVAAAVEEPAPAPAAAAATQEEAAPSEPANTATANEPPGEEVAAADVAEQAPAAAEISQEVPPEAAASPDTDVPAAEPAAEQVPAAPADVAGEPTAE